MTTKTQPIWLRQLQELWDKRDTVGFYMVKEVVETALKQEYARGWNDNTQTIYPYQHKYNKTPKRMETSKHRYHLRKDKKFIDCGICFPNQLLQEQKVGEK